MKIKTKVVWDMTTWEVLEEEGYEYDGPIALAKGGGGSTTTNTVAEPPEWQVPFMQDILANAQSLYRQGGPSYYPGTSVAGFNPNLQRSVSSTEQAAANTGVQAEQAQMALSDLYRAQNPLNNPFFYGTADAMIRPATQQLTQQVLPQIGDTFAQAGQFGSSRQGVAEGSAINNWQQNVLDTVQKFGTSAYGQGLDALARGVALAPQTQQMQTVPGSLYGAAGDIQRTYEQQLIDANMARFNYEQQRPYENLSYYAGLVGNPFGATTTSVGPGQKTGGIPGALGGAALAGGLLETMGMASVANPAFWPVLAGGALLGGLF